MTNEELNERFALLAQGLDDLRGVVSETRADLAHFAERAGVVTTAIQEIKSTQVQQGQLLQSLVAGQERHEAILRSLAAGQERQEAILAELIRQRPSAGSSN